MGVSIRPLRIDEVKIDNQIQSRTIMDRNTVYEYVEAMKGGVKFPPIIVFNDGTAYWLADGFHRVAAAKICQRTAIEAEVHEGSKRDAILFSVGANASHGLRRSNEDKRNAVKKLLDDPEWQIWSDRQIAEKCAVSHTFVAIMRKELSGNGCQIPEERIVQRNGTIYPQRAKKATPTTTIPIRQVKENQDASQILPVNNMARSSRGDNLTKAEDIAILIKEKSKFPQELEVVNFIFNKLSEVAQKPGVELFIPNIISYLAALVDAVDHKY